jgi:DNA-binding transcriptional regulator YiaG
VKPRTRSGYPGPVAVLKLSIPELMAAFVRKVARDDGQTVDAVVADIIHSAMLRSFEKVELHEAETGRKPDMSQDGQDRLVLARMGTDKRLSPADVKKMRTDLSMSQRELATQLGVDVMTVSRWERGTVGVRPRHAFRLRMMHAKRPT